MEGMEELINDFVSIIEDFKSKRHDLLDFHNNKFDRDYVEFNVKISELENSLQVRTLICALFSPRPPAPGGPTLESSLCFSNSTAADPLRYYLPLTLCATI